MNGQQIESLLQLIDCNVALTRTEVASFISGHEEAIVKSLVETGSAVVTTSAGDLRLVLKDLPQTD